MRLRKLTAQDGIAAAERDTLVDFLYEHLDRFGDTRVAIADAVQQALTLPPAGGGFVMTATDEQGLVAAVVILDTKMGRFLPANFLVYIATHARARGQGIGRRLLERVQAETRGGICLHVEPDNPARRLYERHGFTNKYLEMRYEPESRPEGGGA